jgi:hypothetical protein
MKRLLVVGVLLASLAVIPAASAHHTVYGGAKRAVLQSLADKSPALHKVNNSRNCMTLAVRCWRVIVSANSWASSMDVGPGNNGMGEWDYISHRKQGHWRYVGGWGEGIGLNCKKVGMPANVVLDLLVYCS